MKDNDNNIDYLNSIEEQPEIKYFLLYQLFNFNYKMSSTINNLNPTRFDTWSSFLFRCDIIGLGMEYKIMSLDNLNLSSLINLFLTLKLNEKIAKKDPFPT